MRMSETAKGFAELRAARAMARRLIHAAILFSVFVNLLMLTGPLFMLQVYDRVLGSRSEETLVALFMLVAFLFLMMGMLDYARGRIMARVAARFQANMEARVFAATLSAESRAPGSALAASGLRDLDSVQRFMSSPALLAIFDAPWTPLFLGAIFLFHPLLGGLATSGGLVLVAVTLLNQARTRRPALEAAALRESTDRMADQIRSEAETIQSLGMRGATFARWKAARGHSALRALTAADRAGGYGTITRTLRLFLQSAMLALGAWLVLRGELTGGAMIAGSILLGRALAPIEQLIGHWELVSRSSKGWASLGRLLAAVPAENPRTDLPAPRALLEVQQATVIPPGESQAALRMLSFRLEPGQAMGVIGPSGAGKSTLARALTGTWATAGGRIRLDGAALDHYDPDTLGAYIGYLPQRVTLFEGTIAENIARLAPEPDAAAVVAAAKRAAAHDMILRLPNGYDTPVSAAGGRLSGGQVQRIGLARALYGDPVILVLDEPNSNLDNEGSEALNHAIRALKADHRSVLIMAHRPAAIQECDLLMLLDGGVKKAFGPRDEVLRQVALNHSEISRSTGQGGVT
ncbi:type I secretion system permease/ATPase [Oceanicola sp. 502str15]|uniref:type I secretion system permease/ATPase n=1 Tax=Oceanicola sp. 502str15 TaxID=2696061 RepID=UPI0020962D07|nr:type I secretion system permease/ATPase [Oceanicola sp. 502str15]MCO6384569.1 type I secretion system permease/ATPase [Oceanicola sp. 502str15]